MDKPSLLSYETPDEQVDLARRRRRTRLWFNLLALILILGVAPLAGLMTGEADAGAWSVGAFLATLALLFVFEWLIFGRRNTG